MFIWINNGKYVAVINKKFINFFFIWITRVIFVDTKNDMDTTNDFENNIILRIFKNILDDFLDLISSK